MINETTLLETMKNMEFPPLKISKVEFDPIFEESDKRYRPDSIIEVEWQNRSRKFLAEVGRLSKPSFLDMATQQLKRYMNALGNSEYYPLIIIPYLSPEALDFLLKEGMS